MRSPLTNQPMTRTEPEPGLAVWTAPGGVWIDGEAYRAWIAGPEPSDDEHAAEGDAELAPHDGSTDTARALISPRTGRLLVKYRVTLGEPFTIDYDTFSGGFWLDTGEFERLKSLGLHRRLHHVVSPAWQQRLRAMQTDEQRAARVASIIGTDDHARLVEITGWIAGHTHRDLLLAWIREGTES